MRITTQHGITRTEERGLRLFNDSLTLRPTVHYVMARIRAAIPILATPSYKIKKEKRDNKSDKTEAEDSNSTLVDPSLVLVVGVVKDQNQVS